MTGLPAWFDRSGTDVHGRLGRLIERLGPNFGTVKPGTWLAFHEDPGFPGFPMVHYQGVDLANGICRLTLNIRIVPGQTDRSVKADLERLLADLSGGDPNFGSHVELLHPVRYPHSIPDDDPLI